MDTTTAPTHTPPAGSAPSDPGHDSASIGRRDLAALAGIAGAVLYVVSAFTGGPPLPPDAAPDRLIGHLVEHRNGLLVGTVLACLALLALLVFLGRLRQVVAGAADNDPAGDTAGANRAASVTVAAWLSLLVIISAGGAPLTAITWRGAGAADPRTVLLAFDVANLSTYALTAVAAALSVAAPTWALWRAGSLPKWLAGLAAVEIVANVVELAGIGARTGANAAGYAAGVGPFLWILWVIGISVVIIRRTPR